MAYKHGVYTSEAATSLTMPVEGTAGLQVIIGTAPINLAPDPAAVVNTPILCSSYADAIAKLGYCDDWAKYTLCQAISACFKVFNVAPVVLINVLDPNNSEHIKTGTESVTAVGHVAKLATLGIVANTVVVTKNSNALVSGIDYTTEFDEKGYLTITTSTKVADSELSVSYARLAPEGVTAADIIGTATSGAEKGLEVIRQVYPKFGMTAGLLTAPGWSHIPEVAAALQAKCTGINGCFGCETIIDISCNSGDSVKALTYDAVKEAKENTGIDDAHALACWPMAKVGNAKYYMSALLSALLAYTDANNGDVPNISLSNKPLGITGICLADGSEVILDQTQANTINSFGVSTALNVNGFRAWGNNSAAYPATTDPKDRWFAVRRFFTWWANSIVLTYFQQVDEPANYRLIENIVDSENIRGNSFVAQGYCAEARVEFLEDENPVTDILGGKIKFHVFLAPYTPAEDIEFTLEFNPTAIETAVTGGE